MRTEKRKGRQWTHAGMMLNDAGFQPTSPGTYILTSRSIACTCSLTHTRARARETLTHALSHTPFDCLALLLAHEPMINVHGVDARRTNGLSAQGCAYLPDVRARRRKLCYRHTSTHTHSHTHTHTHTKDQRRLSTRLRISAGVPRGRVGGWERP